MFTDFTNYDSVSQQICRMANADKNMENYSSNEDVTKQQLVPAPGEAVAGFQMA
jgi:hypothetical protein